jgi:hypothetical protein
MRCLVKARVISGCEQRLQNAANACGDSEERSFAIEERLGRRCRFPRQDDENALANLLSRVRVPHLAHCNRIDQVDVPRYQRAKRLFEIALRILRTSALLSVTVS